ncbi:MAG TPA: 2-C-methyl-D-erythritol 4-phosphate cytidylyltransferase [Acidimicrobiales bacterium]|nr:2-C-methyl-D-erythritol 4-phosphate cytidylyltransferase [Acidimicrobiales bacterium]
MTVWAIVVAAGHGSRFGRPKQYEPLAGRRVLDWSVAAAAKACDGVVLVVPPDRVDDAEPVDAVVAGGDTRSASVRNGLAAVPPDADVIAVHDAARPLATPALFDAAVDAVRAGAAGAVCAVPVTDTVKRTADGAVVETLDRRHLVSVQTPQAFSADALRAAHAQGPDATDDAALVEAAGGRVVVVPGHAHNFKITHPDDLLVAAALLAGGL